MNEGAGQGGDHAQRQSPMLLSMYGVYYSFNLTHPGKYARHLIVKSNRVGRRCQATTFSLE